MILSIYAAIMLTITTAVLLASAGFWVSTSGQHLLLDENDDWENAFPEPLEKAAPWWVQQEEAAKNKCQSSCTMYSKGVKNPTISLCDDTDVISLDRTYGTIKKKLFLVFFQVCPINRLSVQAYASAQCSNWSTKRILEGIVTGEGRQVKHQPVKGNWLACAVFCKTSSGGQWYAPKKELEALNIDPYFPDGVWCHTDHETETNYYCQNHLCLAEQKP